MSDRMTDDDLTVHRGSGDFLTDQGIADPEEFRVKSHLCHEIATIAEQRGLTAAEIGHLAKEAEQDADRMMNYRHDGYEVWRLVRLLYAIGAATTSSSSSTAARSRSRPSRATSPSFASSSGAATSPGRKAIEQR